MAALAFPVSAVQKISIMEREKLLQWDLEHFVMFLCVKSLVLCCHIFSRALQMALWDSQSLLVPRVFPGGCGSLFIHPHLAECSPSIFLSFIPSSSQPGSHFPAISLTSVP